tara:strand:- start:5317 stop:5454 length:138 start_codon:yes stop_codon:yes gene_type:complete
MAALLTWLTTHWIAIVVGAFVGWNVPQPTYMKKIQTWVMGKIKRN